MTALAMVDTLHDDVMILICRAAQVFEVPGRDPCREAGLLYDERLFERLLDMGAVFICPDDFSQPSVSAVKTALSKLQTPLVEFESCPPDVAELVRDANGLLPLIRRRAIVEINARNRNMAPKS